MHQQDLLHSKWLLSIKNISHECDKEQVWSNQKAPLNNSKIVKLKLIEMYKSTWKSQFSSLPNV